MAQYAKELPVDKNNNPYTIATPAFVSNQSWGSVFTVSSTIGLSDKTTVVQFLAVGQAANIKWGPSSVTATNFDASIPANTPVTLVVPQSIMAAVSVMGANGANGLYNSVSIKQLATGGSVFGAEF